MSRRRRLGITSQSPIDTSRRGIILSGRVGHLVQDSEFPRSHELTMRFGIRIHCHHLAMLLQNGSKSRQIGSLVGTSIRTVERHGVHVRKILDFSHLHHHDTMSILQSMGQGGDKGLVSIQDVRKFDGRGRVPDHVQQQQDTNKTEQYEKGSTNFALHQWDTKRLTYRASMIMTSNFSALVVA